MSKNNFNILLEKYLNGECTSNEKALVEKWFEGLSHSEEINHQNWQEHKEEIWQKIKPSNPTNNYAFLKYAALITLFLGISILLYLFNTTPTAGFTQKISNQGEKYKQITLTDGSSIYLAPNAVLQYPESFEGGFRKVKLSGKAFFKITKDPNKPFLVYSKNIVTKVLGTSFWVNSSESSPKIEVEVISGKVSVFENKNKLLKPKSVLLSVNQKVTYNENLKILETGLVSAPILKEQKEGNDLKFEDSPLREVLKKYEFIYGIKITTDSEHLLELPLTANLNEVPFYTALEIICQSINAKYVIDGTNIVISLNKH